jgi:hypothetical protein
VKDLRKKALYKPAPILTERFAAILKRIGAVLTKILYKEDSCERRYIFIYIDI